MNSRFRPHRSSLSVTSSSLSLQRWPSLDTRKVFGQRNSRRRLLQGCSILGCTFCLLGSIPRKRLSRKKIREFVLHTYQISHICTPYTISFQFSSPYHYYFSPILWYLTLFSIFSKLTQKINKWIRKYEMVSSGHLSWYY